MIFKCSWGAVKGVTEGLPFSLEVSCPGILPGPGRLVSVDGMYEACAGLSHAILSAQLEQGSEMPEKAAGA